MTILKHNQGRGGRMDFETVKEQTQALFLKLHEAHIEYLHLWKNNMLFTWRWWIDLMLIILPWTLWLIFRKRDSSDRLLYAGIVSLILASYMDMMGVVLGLWSYPYSVFPLMPSYIPLDCSVVPVATMLFIQLFPKIKTIYKALIYGAVGAFGFESLLSWVGLYNRMEWKSIYSFPLYILIYLVCNYFSKKMNFAPVS
jgi:hypothetical protein